MRILLITALCAAASGCNSINASTSAFLNASSASYGGARANMQQKNDMALQAWVDAACAMPLGALQRNPNAAAAVLLACPVAALRAVP